jgi:hypothetical protein
MGTNPIVPPTSQRERPFGPLWRIGLVIGLVVAIGLLLALWPFLRALASALTAAVESHGTLIAGALGLFGGALAIGVVRIVWAYGWRLDGSARQARVVRLQNDLPISVDDVHAAFQQLSSRSLDQFYAAKLAEAERPTPLLTSQNLHIHQVGVPSPPALSDSLAMQPLAVPTFAQLLDQGMIGPGRPLILGYDAATGQAITGAWKDLYSCGVGAQQGAGKTWLLAFLLAQSAAGGGRLIICDLHAGDDESLANRIGALAPAFMRDIASTPKEIESAFAFADDKLEKRKTNNARWPIVLVADEWTSLLRTSAGSFLPQHIQNIAEQGRKFNVNGILAAQAWTKAASSDVRNQLTSHYVMRQRPEEARYQLGLRAEQLPSDIRQLPDATGYLLNVAGDLIKIVVPHMTSADIARCGELIDSPAGSPAKFGFIAPTQRLPGSPPAELTRNSDGSQKELRTNVTATAAQSAKPVSVEAARARELFDQGADIADIIRELRGELTGRARQQASMEIQQLIREGRQS